MKITHEDSLISAISEEIESETVTDATATAREIVITVATFEATKEGPCEPALNPEPEGEPDLDPEPESEPKPDPGNSGSGGE